VLASPPDAIKFRDAVAFVHQFMFGTTFVRECSRQDNVLAATMPGDREAEWPRIRADRADRIHIDHSDRCGEDCTAPRPSEHPNRVDEPQSVLGGRSIRPMPSMRPM
jgi:hypothetical protein